MRRPQFKLKSLLIATSLIGYLLVTAPYWYGLARLQYMEYRIRVIRQELSPAARAKLQSELDALYLERSIHPSWRGK